MLNHFVLSPGGNTLVHRSIYRCTMARERLARHQDERLGEDVDKIVRALCIAVFGHSFDSKVASDAWREQSVSCVPADGIVDLHCGTLRRASSHNSSWRILGRREFAATHRARMLELLKWPAAAKTEPQCIELYVSRDVYYWMAHPPYPVPTKFVRVDALDSWIRDEILGRTS